MAHFPTPSIQWKNCHLKKFVIFPKNIISYIFSHPRIRANLVYLPNPLKKKPPLLPEKNQTFDTEIIFIPNLKSQFNIKFLYFPQKVKALYFPTFHRTFFYAQLTFAFFLLHKDFDIFHKIPVVVFLCYF